MDYKTLYKPYLAPCGTKIMDLPSHLINDFYKRCVLITECLEEVERTKLKQSISQSLKCKSLGKTDYVFLTVGFDPSKSFEECFKAAQKLGNRKIWVWSHWCHEQRGETLEDAGKGHHIHLVAKIAAPNAKSRSKSTVCHVADVKNSAIFHWKYIPEEYLEDKIAYITDQKAIEKQAKQAIDKIWRTQNNISAVYHNAGEEEVCTKASSP